jgi:hypothetical protein
MAGLSRQTFKRHVERKKRMKLSVKAATIAGGLLWGGAILLVGLINLISPGYGLAFLQMMSSVYPWFNPSHTLSSILVGSLEGFLDGAIASLLFAWLYNALMGRRKMLSGTELS